VPAEQAGLAGCAAVRRSQRSLFLHAATDAEGSGRCGAVRRNFAGDQPFVVALGDSILGLHAQSKTVLRMTELFEERGASCVIAVEEVPPEQTVHYGIVKVEESAVNVCA